MNCVSDEGVSGCTDLDRLSLEDPVESLPRWDTTSFPSESPSRVPVPETSDSLLKSSPVLLLVLCSSILIMFIRIFHVDKQIQNKLLSLLTTFFRLNVKESAPQHCVLVIKVVLYPFIIG